jgi:hypothetical protein
MGALQIMTPASCTMHDILLTASLGRSACASGDQLHACDDDVGRQCRMPHAPSVTSVRPSQSGPSRVFADNNKHRRALDGQQADSMMLVHLTTSGLDTRTFSAATSTLVPFAMETYECLSSASRARLARHRPVAQRTRLKDLPAPLRGAAARALTPRVRIHRQAARARHPATHHLRSRVSVAAPACPPGLSERVLKHSTYPFPPHKTTCRIMTQRKYYCYGSEVHNVVHNKWRTHANSSTRLMSSRRLQVTLAVYASSSQARRACEYQATKLQILERHAPDVVAAVGDLVAA